MPDSGPPQRFGGFDEPNFTQVPNQFFDKVYQDLSFPELRVALYIVRHTFGWSKATDKISLSQFVEGVKKDDGTVIDRGCGIAARGNVQRALNSLVKRNIIVRQSGIGHRGVGAVTTYSLNLSRELSQIQLSEGRELSHRGLSELSHRGPPVITQRHTKETSTKDNYTKDDDVSNSLIFVKAERVFGKLNRVLGEKIGDAIATYGHEKVMSALDKTAMANGRSWTYAEKILIGGNTERSNGRGPAPPARDPNRFRQPDLIYNTDTQELIGGDNGTGTDTGNLGKEALVQKGAGGNSPPRDPNRVTEAG